MQNKIKVLAFSAMFTAFTAIGAFIKIPIPPYPVPMTLQTAFLFLAGLLLPMRAAFFSQLAYVLIGLIGVPIFTNGGGIGYILDPTFGYLIAFLYCAPLMSKLAEKTLYAGRKIAFAMGACLLVLSVQLCGAGYMALVSSAYLHVPLSFSRAVSLVLLFLPLDLVKLSIACVLALQLKKRVPYLFGDLSIRP